MSGTETLPPKEMAQETFPASKDQSTTSSSKPPSSHELEADEKALPANGVERGMAMDDEPPEGATVFTTPNAAEVKGKLFSTYWAVWIAGLNDAATGALIPYLQPAYNIGLLEVAIVYLVNFVGWLIAAFSNVHITARFGQGGALVIGAVAQLIAYVLIFWKPPFALFAIAFFFSGLGVALQDAQANTFAASVQNAHRWLGILHAVYGLGALIAPLIATTIAVKTPKWHYYYIFMLGVSALNIVFLCYTFRKRLFKEFSATARDTASRELKQALSERATWLLSGFFFLYVGAEVTSGGWVVQFLITVRHGEPSHVGYVASGFWAGLMVGRIVLADIVNKLGERRMVLVLIILALTMQFIYWFVPNVIANAIVVSFLGFFIAPFFPVGISVLSKLLPRELHVASIGFTSTVGQAGSAAFPFMTGAIASKAGVKVLQPIMVGLLGGMFVLWACLARVRQPTE